MPDRKITELPAATLPIAAGVKFEAVQGGINVQVDADDMPGGVGTVTSVSGTPNRITSTGGATPVIDIAAAFEAAITAEIAAAIAASTNVVDQVSASTAAGTITLDMNSQLQRSFVGSASFATPKTIALSNTTNALFFNLFINVTNVAAVVTVPADWFMSDIQFDGTAWTPPETGRYELGGSFDGTNWWVKIQGPFS
jgi:hypothetical protein